jgi:hypothetical protein
MAYIFLICNTFNIITTKPFIRREHEGNTENENNVYVVFKLSKDNFPPCYSQSYILTDFNPTPLLSKSGLKLVCNVNLYTKTSNLRTLKIMPSNLNEILRSWIRLLVKYLKLTWTVFPPPGIFDPWNIVSLGLLLKLIATGISHIFKLHCSLAVSKGAHAIFFC